MTTLNSKDIALGRERLHKMLPAAREQARRDTQSSLSTLAPNSLLGMSVLEHLREENLDMLVVYEDSPGAWYADLILKDTPTGIPDTLGTPVDHPLDTKEAAEDAALSLLTRVMGEILIAQASSRDTPRKNVRVFRACDIEFSIPYDLISKFEEDREGIEEDGDAPIEVQGERILQRACLDISGRDHLDQDAWSKASENQKLNAFAGMAMMLVGGQFRYPPAPQVSLKE